MANTWSLSRHPPSLPPLVARFATQAKAAELARRAQAALFCGAG